MKPSPKCVRGSRSPMPSSERAASRSTAIRWAAVLILTGILWGEAHGEGGSFRLSGGLKAVSTTYQSAAAVSTPYPRPPLEGPLVRVALKVTDESNNLLDQYATVHSSVSGSALPAATTGSVFALLDSGASTHLISYPDGSALGFDATWMTDNIFGVGGVGDDTNIELRISMPSGIFAHGLQDLDGSGNPQPSLMVGHGNFALGVNSLSNNLAGYEVPTLIGAPHLFDFGVIVSNSAPIEKVVDGTRISTPSVTFFSNPSDTNVPTSYAHRFFIELLPSPATQVQYVPDVFVNLDFLPLTPSIIPDGVLGLSAALYFTSSSVTYSNAGLATSGQVLFDTGAQACILSELAAADLGLNLNNPDFEVEVQGITGTLIAPGFFLDSLTLPALGGLMRWSEVPVVIINVASPEGGTMFGVFGSNLLGNRDYVFNSIASPAYVDVFDPTIAPQPEITAVRFIAPDVMEVDWLCEPAAPELLLRSVPGLLPDPPAWTAVSTGALPTVMGTLSVTGSVDHEIFQVIAPLNDVEEAELGGP